MTQAVIKTGGKQYLVSPGKIIKVEKIETENSDEITFNEVLLFSDGKTTKIGTPFIQDVHVKAKVLSQGKNDKIIVFKYKPKKRYSVKKGHRQSFTEVEIVDIKIKGTKVNSGEESKQESK